MPSGAIASADHSSDQPPGGGLRILVVDDEADTVETTAMLLEMEGHDVQQAVSGREALERVGPFSPHLALIDLAMPVVDGFEVARAIRQMKLESQPTLAAVTGGILPRYKRLCAEAGFDHYLRKPVNFDELSQVVRLATPIERFAALKVRNKELVYDIVFAQVEFCDLVLQGVTKLSDRSAQRRNIDKVMRTQSLATTWLRNQQDLLPDERSRMEIRIAAICMRLTALGEQLMIARE
jgi:CheY-like chemotaxis protein